MLKTLIKRSAAAILGEYALYRIWQSPPAPTAAAPGALTVRPLGADALAAPGVPPELAESAWYLGSQACAFGCYDGEQLLGAAFFWWGERYATRRSWPIEDGAAKLVHIVTTASARGRGVASCLMQGSALALRERGFTRLYARVWHSNEPSQRAFAKAGWQTLGWQVQFNPLRLRRPWTLHLRGR